MFLKGYFLAPILSVLRSINVKIGTNPPQRFFLYQTKAFLQTPSNFEIRKPYITETRLILQKPLIFSGIKPNPLKQLTSYLVQAFKELNERALPSLGVRSCGIKRLENRKVKQETHFGELRKTSF